MSHTPGPWHVNDRGWGSSIGVVAAKPFGGKSFGRGRAAKNICVVTRVSDAEMAQANARLIAAAPELLAYLTDLWALVEDNCPSLLKGPGGDFLLAAVIPAAIAKATGGDK